MLHYRRGLCDWPMEDLIFMSAGLPIPFPLQMSKEGLNKLFGRTVSKLGTLKQTTTYTRSLQHHRRGQGSDAPADVERRAQVSIFTPHQLRGYPRGLPQSPFSRCRSESMSQRFTWVGTPSRISSVFPPLVLCGLPLTHTSLRLPLPGIHCTPPGSSWCQSHLKALLSIQPLPLTAPYKNA